MLGDFRDQAGFLGLEQDLPKDAAADVFFTVELERLTERFGDRAYRAAQLEAGVMGGRLYLAAYAQGFGASGSPSSTTRPSTSCRRTRRARA